MEFALAGLNFSISAVEDGFEFPAPNQMPKKIVFMRQLRRAVQGWEGFEEGVRYWHLGMLLCG
jgi:hypothetical protein